MLHFGVTHGHHIQDVDYFVIVTHNLVS